ncbi:TOBE domain-containing protein [Phenylobacterium sp.]|jgi:molybdate transport system regulatory protein|uniref:TOBE domain-containing protein n=1 Tax=Phenylobacterium sp. TaxID=1871053 RepID=UPI003783C64B
MTAGTLTAALSFARDGSRAGTERMALLEAIGELGSIRAAAARLGLSYKGAWDAVKALNNLFDAPLVVARAGGAQGGAAELTPRGQAALAAFKRIEADLAEAVGRLEHNLAGDDDLRPFLWSLGMRTSARNVLRGVVAEVREGEVSAEVTLTVGAGAQITAIITRESLRELGLAVGKPALALIKSSFVVLAKGEGLVTSARNQLAGRVSRREDGAVSSEIDVEIADGKTLTASVTRASAEAMELSPGAAVTALVKAPHVILAVE